MSENSDIEDVEDDSFLSCLKARIEVDTESGKDGCVSEWEYGEDEPVSCVFTWSHGGHEVYLTGSFNNWSQRVKMMKNGHEFVTVLELPRDRHLYKFVVDEMWKFAPDQETATDELGHVNNVLDITNHQRFCCHEPRSGIGSLAAAASQDGSMTFTQMIPDAGDYTTDAPMISQLLCKTQCPAMHPPPLLTAPMHGLANHIYHDSAVGSSIGPNTSSTSMIYRLSKNETQRYVISIYSTLSPMARHTPVVFNNVMREFVGQHFVSAR